jgi:vancomycin permeability regulator SanA
MLKALRMIIQLAIIIAILIPLVMTIPRLVTALHARQRIYKQAETPEKRVAIVFGAGLRRDGSPTQVLRDRVETASKLYFAGRVEKLLMSGDNRFIEYNEPAAMRDYAIELGVPEEAIVLDFAGRRTYDTCYRARDIFSVREAILVTQVFHLPRAIYICNKLGIPAIGVQADNRLYRRSHLLFWNIREIIATSVALWEVHVSRPLPTLGNPEPIFPLEAQ